MTREYDERELNAWAQRPKSNPIQRALAKSSSRRDEFALRTMAAFAGHVSLASDPQVKFDFISKVVGLADALMMTLDGDERINYKDE